MIRYEQCFNILIHGSQAYERSVVEQLEKVRKRWTGWAVLKSIFDAGLNKKEIYITPYTEEDHKAMGDENAFARSRSGTDAAPHGASQFGGGADKDTTADDERYRFTGVKGTGAGSSSDIHYTPFQPAPRCPTGPNKVVTGPCKTAWSSDNDPDDLLLHELIHSLRHLLGQSNPVPTWNKGYDNEEEFIAIVLTNIYMCEKGSTHLRANHHGYGKIDDTLSSSEKFLGKGVSVISTEQLENRKLINKLVCDNYDVCSAISDKLKSLAFNPIGEYMRNSTKYPHDPKKAYAV